jgi:hypothetical protein
LQRELQDTKDQLQAKSIQCQEMANQANLFARTTVIRAQELATQAAKLENSLRGKDDTIKAMAGRVKAAQLDSQKLTNMLDDVKRELMFVQQEKKSTQEQYHQQQNAIRLAETKCTNTLAA